MESKVKDTRVEGWKISRTRGKRFEVFLRQGLKMKALGERGSLRCCYSKASCSLLLPGKTASSRIKYITKTRGFDEIRSCYNKAFHQTLERVRP
jgi:hypothetical protein